jgi:hypothetical protein
VAGSDPGHLIGPGCCLDRRHKQRVPWIAESGAAPPARRILHLHRQSRTGGSVVCTSPAEFRAGDRNHAKAQATLRRCGWGRPVAGVSRRVWGRLASWGSTVRRARATLQAKSTKGRP